MIAIIDYDMGNLRSVEKALVHLGAEAIITRDAALIADASHVVLPGVGAFKDCMANLEAYELVEPIKSAVDSGKPFLGICLGLQLLFEESVEQGVHKGLGILKGRVERFPEPHHTDFSELKVPHMGWNEIKKQKDSKLLDGINDGDYFYFVHSFYCAPDDGEVSLTTTEYGLEFVSAIERDNLMALQFHPEKSQEVGLKVLENFMRMN